MARDRLLAASAYGAALLAIGHAAWSVYWTAGGSALLDTVGGSAEEAARRSGRRLPRRRLERVAVVAGGLLAAYGGVLTVVGAVALTGALGDPDDPRALRWHVLLWDPWFLLWGLLLLAAALLSRGGARRSGERGRGPAR